MIVTGFDLSSVMLVKNPTFEDADSATSIKFPSSWAALLCLESLSWVAVLTSQRLKWIDSSYLRHIIFIFRCVRFIMVSHWNAVMWGYGFARRHRVHGNLLCWQGVNLNLERVLYMCRSVLKLLLDAYLGNVKRLHMEFQLATYLSYLLNKWYYALASTCKFILFMLSFLLIHFFCWCQFGL